MSAHEFGRDFSEGDREDASALSGLSLTPEQAAMATDASGTVHRDPWSEDGNTFRIVRASERFGKPPQPWIVRGVILRQGLTCIYAEPKAGKSLIVLDLSAVMIGGFRFMGEIQAEPIDYVVYMSGEGQGGMGGRLRALLKAHPDLDRHELGERLLIAEKVVRLADEDGPYSVAELREWFLAFIATIPARADGSPARVVFILDTWANAANGIDSNDYQPITDAMQRLSALSMEAAVSIIVIHHANKQGRFMGNQAFYASVDLMFDAEKRGEKGGTLSLLGGKDTGGFSARDYEIKFEDIEYQGDDGNTYTDSAAWIEWLGKSKASGGGKLTKAQSLITQITEILAANGARSGATGWADSTLITETGLARTTLLEPLLQAFKDGTNGRLRQTYDKRQTPKGIYNKRVFYVASEGGDEE